MRTALFTLTLLAAGASGFAASPTDNSSPHLELHHGIKQLYVDGKPFLVLSGELGNSAASSAAWMEPIWPQLAHRNLNTVIASVTWQMIEPVEGRFDFSSVDNCIYGARTSNLHLVFLWFASWKNGQSSYPPDWVKNDPQRFPWAKDGFGNTMNILSTFSDALGVADAKAFAALMRHIREVDGKNHTVLMMQVENEVGIVGDSRDRSAAANAAFVKPVPRDLMNYLVQHKATLAPELLEVWAANGNKTAGTWEEVFGPGKAPTYKVYGPDLTDEKKNLYWKQLNWASDEFFMAWRYSTFANRVAAAGKAEYSIPMYCNAWQQQPGCPRPGEYPSGGPVPQVNDIWRCGAPNLDFLAPDLYIPEFDWDCARYTRNGNPLFIPEANTGGSAPGNALIALIKYNGIGYSPFGIERERPGGRGGFGGGRSREAQGTNEAPAAPTAPPPDAFAQTYALLQYLSPAILDNQGKGTMILLNETTDTNAEPQVLKLGEYTLSIKYGVRTDNGGGRGGRGGGFGGFGGFGGGSSTYTNVSPLRLVINTGPGAYVFVGGPMTVTFKPNEPARGKVVLSQTVESINQDGKWLPGRWLNGDETAHNTRSDPAGSGIYLRTFGVYGYSVFQRN
jgi:hypothetical protein